MCRLIWETRGTYNPVNSSILVAILYSCESSWIWCTRAGWSSLKTSSWGNLPEPRALPPPGLGGVEMKLAGGVIGILCGICIFLEDWNDEMDEDGI